MMGVFAVSEILDLDATRLAKKIKGGEISSLQATEAYINHIKEVNVHINAMIETRFEQAIEEAKQADEQLKKGEGNSQRKLFGVPISIKEAFHVKGMKTTSGLQHRANLVEQEDSEVARRLKNEGAVILGKTNTPTLCFCQETDNKIYGKTSNPWKLTHTSGGSSGGEGALIAVGGAAVGIGSDIGGSLRFPGHFNGVITFKSGNDQVSQDGHYAYVGDPYQYAMLGMGAVAKSVDDAELINSIIAKNEPKVMDADQFQLIIPDKHPSYPLNEGTNRLLQEVKQYFSEKKGITEEYPPMFEEMATMWQLIMSIDGGESIKAAASSSEKRFNPFIAYAQEKMAKNSEWHQYLSWALIGTTLFKPTAKQKQELMDQLHKAIEENEQFLENRVLVLPVYHSPAQEHGNVYKELFSITKSYRKYIPYVAYANTLGLPALTIPVGTDANGLPIALQLISRVGNEQAIFHYGRMIEKAFRGYERCKFYD